VIHGELGENGQLQALLEKKDFQYCDSGAIASRLWMDKNSATIIANNWGILTTRSCFLGGQSLEELCVFIGGPFVGKPKYSRSSVDISKTSGREDVESRRQDWSSGKWIVGACIEGREIMVGNLGSQLLPVIEIQAKDGFYDYRRKIAPGVTGYFVPAPLPTSWTNSVERISQKNVQSYGCRDFPHLDSILGNAGKFFLETLMQFPG
jgi:D-alanine-D-alanine ligase